MSTVKAKNEKQVGLPYLALMHLEYIFSEYEDFGAHEEEFKARAYAAYQIILDLLATGRKQVLADALSEVEQFDKMRRKKAA